MEEHFGFTKAQYDALLKGGVTVRNMLDAVSAFDPIKSGLPLTTVNLYYLIDKVGDFRLPPFTAEKKIAKVFFENFSAKEKIKIFDYLEGDEDDGG